MMRNRLFLFIGRRGNEAGAKSVSKDIVGPLIAAGVLVVLRAVEEHVDALVAEGQALHRHGDELGATERTGETEEYQSAISVSEEMRAKIAWTTSGVAGAFWRGFMPTVRRNPS
ncbi:hypothetical protein IHQ71_24390 [Rhizobium sp. TH2]|uniref:hypothetical protein n=1 Tax=Rhizobium sp. TH2 TaxID=2775403 RepID=UPI002157B3E7|nr:hypothetical protein [Rhizobium sp. TH2]UVC08255.1 hypothetical protein IHQ71_24390 [Rhizobium sp. TH2]